ncbi:helix-turn-helix transcriptional regulator [Rhodomicrobium vannielii ATCC 17100]|uniref:response regulator transcription factor n=1 Tax=Rhodomicrobium vannielii TaxID=1069 RepID=UPI001919C2AE|nr:helix-turn-helix transcriptional regulator [Rhodomicrobium vannielii]MBJ7535869.1 helix-turn-helix transcriptional regulator [Rhodomicrobium vannielii ATCC 17100]
MSRGIATILSDLFDQIAVAVFIISGSGALLFANRSGNAMIEEGWPIRLVNGALMGVDTSGSDALKKALDKRLADGAGDQAICLAIAGQGRPSAVGYLRAIPNGETVASMLLVTQTGRTAAYGLEGLASAYNLSKAETRILKHLVEAQSLPEVAQRLNLSLPTVKSHMRRILTKTQCSRQADLLRIVEGARAYFHRPRRDG